MLLSSEIKIKINNTSLQYYLSKGYDVKIGGEITIKAKDLSHSSTYQVLVKCDICGREKELMYNKYYKNIKKYNLYTCSNKCSYVKNKKTNLEKYGTENYSNREKYKETCLERYGVENASENLDIKKNISKKNKNVWEKRLLNDFNVIKKVDDANYELYCDCDKNHNYIIHRDLLHNRKQLNTILCTICNPPSSYFVSGKELQLKNYIDEIYKINGQQEYIILKSKRNVIYPNELDIYIPELKLAFEFNGLWWHSEINKDKNYHLNKTEKCEKLGIQLIHIYEDDWLYKQNIIKSMILNKLGKTTNKIFARKTEIKEISNNKLIRDFLNKNHIQGFVGSKVKIGLFYHNELVSLITFGSRRVSMGKKSTNEGEFELLRFCNKLNTNVIGGASKLFNHFIKNYNPSEITTYADRSFSNGNLYKQLGFEFAGKTQPNYYYIIDGIRQHRFNYRKDVLVKKVHNSIKTEHKIMLEKNIYRIYDSGNLKFNYVPRK